MTHDALQRLKALAEGATAGPWAAIGGTVECGLDEFGRVAPQHVCATESDAAYIAALHPGTALALIARIEQMEALVEEAYEEATAGWGIPDAESRFSWSKSDTKRALDALRGEPTCEHEWRVRHIATGDGVPVEARFCYKCGAAENRVLPYRMPESDA